MSQSSSTCVPFRLCVFLLVGAASSPALADHAGPAGVGTGATINVISPDTLQRGKSSIGFRLAYIRPDQRSDAVLEALASQHIHAHNTDYNLTAVIGVAYGLTDRLTISAELPYLRRDNLREGEHSHEGGQAINEVEELGSVSGIGDASIIAKFRAIKDGGTGLALIAGLKIPVGSTHRTSKDGERLETEHQPGTGSWDPLVGAAFGTELGPLEFNAGATYQFSGKGAEQTRLGDRAQGGIALSHHFGPAEHHHGGGGQHDEAEHHHHDEGAHHDHGHQSWDAFLELTGEWEGRQRIGGEIEEESGGKSIWLSPGARFNSAGGFSIAGSIGVPVWQDIRASHPDNDYRLTLSLGHAL